jgi:hypothetical protein
LGRVIEGLLCHRPRLPQQPLLEARLICWDREELGNAGVVEGGQADVAVQA